MRRTREENTSWTSGVRAARGDAKDAPTLRHRLALREANGGVVLRQCDDPRAGILGQTAEPSGPGRPVGAEHLTASIHHRLLPGPADDRRHRGEGDILEVAGPEFYLLRVVEDVDAGAQLGERGGVGGGPARRPGSGSAR